MINRRRLVTCLAAAAVSAFAFAAHAIDRDFRLNNATGAEITRFYASPTSMTQWGGDLLGSGVLPANNSVLIHYTPRMYRGQCSFDLKIVDPDGNETVANNINLCTITQVTFSRENGHIVAHAQ